MSNRTEQWRCYSCPQNTVDPIKTNCRCTGDDLIEMNFTDCPNNRVPVNLCYPITAKWEFNGTNFQNWYMKEYIPTKKCIPMRTPTRSLTRTPIRSPMETPQETLARTPMETLAITPIKTLLFTPFETPTGLIESKILYQEPNDPYLYFIIPIVVLSVVNVVLLILYCRRKKTTQETSEESETSQIEPRITRSQSFPNFTITVDSYMAEEDPFSQDFHSDPDSEVIEN